MDDNEDRTGEDRWRLKVIGAVRGMRYGSVEIVVHDGRVVQIETRERVRFDDAGRRSPVHRERRETE